MYLSRTWKLFTFSLLLVTSTLSCKKQKPIDPPRPVDPPSIFESILTSHTFSFCGPGFTSTLKISDGTDIGTVTVGNDSLYLYLTYNLTGNWYLGEVHSYAGRESQLPRNIDGNPIHEQFAGKQDLNICDQRQAFTFRVLLSNLSVDDDSQCPTNDRYYIAMRASVKQFASQTDCITGVEQAAWGAPFLINPGNSNEWATAFYYCRQQCVSICAYSQGYWFSNPNPNASWCQPVKYGALEVGEQQGDSLWPPQNNWVKRAFFQGSALQLSMNCVNTGYPMPASIVNDYNRLETFLSTLTYADLQNGTFPLGTDTTGVRASSSNVGRWICNNHCTSNLDPTACTGY